MSLETLWTVTLLSINFMQDRFKSSTLLIISLVEILRIREVLVLWCIWDSWWNHEGIILYNWINMRDDESISTKVNLPLAYQTRKPSIPSSQRRQASQLLHPVNCVSCPPPIWLASPNWVPAKSQICGSTPNLPLSPNYRNLCATQTYTTAV